MLSPNAENIETASDQLKGKQIPDFISKSQLKELGSYGDVRAQSLGASGLSKDFQAGYELGLQTARVVISQSVTLVIAGVNPSNVL